MTSNEKAAAKSNVIHYGSPLAPDDQWVPFEWNEPKLGKQVSGEVAIARAFGSSGSLSCGFWRTGPTTQGSKPDGTHTFVYTAPLGDETAYVVEGTATLTVMSSGASYKIKPGSIVSSPKGLEVRWAVDGPFFKKFWCVWNGSEAASNPPSDLKVNHISDEPDDWIEHRFTEPDYGELVAGELYFVRSGGSTGTMLSGVWRSGKGFPGTKVDSKGTLTTPYTGVLGDETIYLVHGDTDVVEVESGKRHSFKAGDIVGLTAGMPVTYVAKGPFSVKLFIVTEDKLL